MMSSSRPPDGFDAELSIDQRTREREPSMPPMPRVRPVHLLFVDDDPLAEMTLRRAFRRLSMEEPLTIAHDGLEALDVLRDPWFPRDRCVVLLDLNMPRMDGIELLKELRGDPELAQVPVVVMTTSDEQRDVQAAYAGRVSGYFVKPVSFGQFVEQVRAILAYWSMATLPPIRGGSGLLTLP